jgi:hypothetical protein
VRLRAIGALDLAGVAHAGRAQLHSQYRRHALDGGKLADSGGNGRIAKHCRARLQERRVARAYGSSAASEESTAMRRTRAPCCACAVSDQVAAELSRSVMNSRRFMGRTPRPEVTGKYGRSGECIAAESSHLYPRWFQTGKCRTSNVFRFAYDSTPSSAAWHLDQLAESRSCYDF